MEGQEKSRLPNIQLVACAKDEAAYLPEWIFYHLDIGFSSIKIYINNTTDNSVAILDKIIKKYPQVSYVLADELIKNPPIIYKEKTNENFYKINKIQAVIYVDALANVDKNKIKYMVFLDIDEFFFPKKPVAEFFSNDSFNNAPKKIKWLLLSGDQKEFSSLDQCRKGYLDDLFKSIVPLASDTAVVQDPHTFTINGDSGSFDDGALILHRVLRSKKEYLFLLSRSTSDENSKLVNGFKKNRRGWTDRGKDIHKFGVNISSDHKLNFYDFIQSSCIDSELSLARNRVLKKYHSVKEEVSLIQQQNIELTRSLGGIDATHIKYFKTMLHSLAWGVIRLLSPRLVLSHESLRNVVLSFFSKDKV